MRTNSFNETLDDYPICLLKRGFLTYDLKKHDELENLDTNELFIISDIKPDELGRVLISHKKINESQSCVFKDYCYAALLLPC